MTTALTLCRGCEELGKLRRKFLKLPARTTGELGGGRRSEPKVMEGKFAGLPLGHFCRGGCPQEQEGIQTWRAGVRVAFHIVDVINDLIADGEIRRRLAGLRDAL